MLSQKPGPAGSALAFCRSGQAKSRRRPSLWPGLARPILARLGPAPGLRPGQAQHYFSLCYAGYRLPYHKTDPFYRGTDILFFSQSSADPVSLLQVFVTARDKLHGARSALFLRKDNSHPTRAWFDAKLFSFVDRSFGGHSARAGGATFYASLGLSESVIMALGRWSSEAWKTYIRENPSVRAALQLTTLHYHH